MFFPESLYVLSQRDQQVTWLDPVLQEVNLSQAAAQLDLVAFTVPIGRALILQTSLVVAIPGAAQNFNSIQLRIQPPDPAATEVTLGFQPVAGAANARGFVQWIGSLIIPSLWRVSSQALFNAGAAANLVEHSVFGLLVPVANIQRV